MRSLTLALGYGGSCVAWAVTAVAAAEPAARYRAIDLGPALFPYTQAVGVGGSQQVGFGSVAPLYPADYYSTYSDGNPHALLWNGAVATDLHPAGFSASLAVATTGDHQVGFGRTAGGMNHALIWDGTAAGVVDLNPSNVDASAALGAAGTHQVGWGIQANAVDLHPAGYSYSVAEATTGTQHVGYGFAPTFNRHALLWTGTSSAAVDLNPLDSNGQPNRDQASVALGIGGNQQVGFRGSDTFSDLPVHAVLWTGTAASAIDLNPPGPLSPTHFFSRVAAATNGSQQVGYGSTGSVFDVGYVHALLWSGTADSMVDLHQSLPPGFGSSQAVGIDAAGNVVGWASPANFDHGLDHAILWEPVPEPGSLLLIGVAAVGLLARRRCVTRRGLKAGWKGQRGHSSLRPRLSVMSPLRSPPLRSRPLCSPFRVSSLCRNRKMSRFPPPPCCRAAVRVTIRVLTFERRSAVLLAHHPAVFRVFRSRAAVGGECSAVRVGRG